MELDLSFGGRKSKPNTENSVSDILARAKDTLSQKIDVSEKQNYYVPRRNIQYFEFLSDYEVRSGSHLSHLYQDTPDHYPDKIFQQKYKGRIVFHGHPVGSGCYANTFCHVMGYVPTGEEHPGFIRQFYLKWPSLK